MKLIFENSYGVERVVADVQSEKEALAYIYKFCEERNFKVYYTRIWETNGRKHFDVGSHTEFFHLEDDSEV